MRSVVWFTAQISHSRRDGLRYQANDDDDLDKEGDTDESLKAIEFGVDRSVECRNRSDGEHFAWQQCNRAGGKPGRDESRPAAELTRATLLHCRIEYQPASDIPGAASLSVTTQHERSRHHFDSRRDSTTQLASER